MLRSCVEGHSWMSSSGCYGTFRGLLLHRHRAYYHALLPFALLLQIWGPFPCRLCSCLHQCRVRIKRYQISLLVVHAHLTDPGPLRRLPCTVPVAQSHFEAGLDPCKVVVVRCVWGENSNPLSNTTMLDTPLSSPSVECFS